jgi:heat shock protein HtpX
MKNNAKTAVILAGIGGLMIIVGGAIGQGAGAAIGLLLGLVFVGGSYWFSDKLAIKAAKAVEVSAEQMPRYHAIVADLAQRADIPMPRLYVSPDPQPNAFATGRSPEHAAVCVNKGILDVLTWEELQGVLAHEISHVRNRDILISSVAASVAMGITFLAQMAMWASMFGGGGRDRNDNIFGTLAIAILAPIAAAFLQAALSRSREYEADRRGAKLLGTGEPLAAALEKLDRGTKMIPSTVNPAQASAYIANPFAGQKSSFSVRMSSTHPPMEDRIARLRSGEWQH